MLTIDFKGWFQVRLATDPDPYDEPRGVSGYVRAYAGEPDLDRVVHWQAPPFVRALGPTVGVTVSSIAIDGAVAEQSPLSGANVILHGSPTFEGRNGVVAEDGFEPLYPMDLEISNRSVTLRRAVVPHDEDFPFEGLFAGGVDVSGAAEIQQATGIQNLADVWKSRLEALKRNPPTTDPGATATKERIAFLEQQASGGRSAARFFAARMNYSCRLTSVDPVVSGLRETLAFEPDLLEPWLVRFWLGGWDADVLCGYCSGRLTIPRRSSTLETRTPPKRGVHRDLI